MYFSELISSVAGAYSEQVNLDGYVFDAYLRLQHQQRLAITNHPVESGSPITDNAYPEPKSFQLEILMSETTTGKVYGQFGLTNRSINAYKLLNRWQEERKTITFNSKYGYFQNCLVEEVTPTDDYTTKYGMRVSVTLKQIIVTSTQRTVVSASSWMTDRVQRGNQNAEAPSENVSILVQTGLFEGSK